MCLFTHLAAGALAGGLIGNVPAGAVAGLASHALLDALPHWDFPSWRIEVIGAAISLGLLLLLGLATPAALAGGLAALLPDLEILLWKLGRIPRGRFLYPSHNGLVRHGRTTGPGSLAWQLALTAACFLALGLAGPRTAVGAAAGRDAPEPTVARFGAPVVELIGGGAAESRLRFRFPVEEAPADWATASAERVRWHRAPARIPLEDGRTSLAPALAGALLAVPGEGPPAWTLEAVRWWREPSREVPPDSLVSVGTPRIMRDVPLLEVRVPVWTAGGGIPAEVVVVVRHPPAGRYDRFLTAATARRLRPAPGAAAGGGMPAAPASLLNPDLFAALAEGARSVAAETAAKARPAEAHPFELTPNWIRLEVSETGVHAYRGYDLLLAGVLPSTVDPAGLRLYKGGGLPLPQNPTLPDSLLADRSGLREVAILVEDQDGEWDEGDRILFYGVSGRVWMDRVAPGARRLDHFEHLYDPRGIYWLTWSSRGEPSPLPGSPRRLAVLEAPARGSETLMSAHLKRVHLEQSGVMNSELAADGWVWNDLIGGESSFSFTAPLVQQAPQPDSPSAALDLSSNCFFLISWRARGFERNYSSTLIQASAALNDDPAAVRTSFTLSQQDDSLQVRLAGWSSWLRPGLNSVKLRNETPTPSRGERPFLALDCIDLLYWEPLVKGSGQLAFSLWPEQGGAGQEIDMQLAVGSQGVVVWDVSDPLAPALLNGTEAPGPPRTLTVGVVGDPVLGRHFLALSPATAAELFSPVARRARPRPLRTDWQPIDYLVVHESRFFAAAAELAALRSRRLPGLAAPAAALVDEQDVYDSFSGGLKDPYAIRNYLHFLYRQYDRQGSGHELAFVCLLGDASRDWRNNLRRQPDGQIFDYLPAALRTTFPKLPHGAYWYNRKAYASDDELVSFDPHPGYPWSLDLPELACGRLPVRTAAEATAVVRRIVQAEESPEPGRWRNRVVVSADDFSQPGQGFSTAELAHTTQAEVIADQVLPITLDVEKLYLIDYEQSGLASLKPAARRRAIQLLSEGTTIFYYVGHGGKDVLADEHLFEQGDIPSLNNGARRGLFTAFSCDVGIYDDPYRQSMAEDFVTHPGGGSLLSVAASEVTYVYPNDKFSTAFFQNLYPGRTVPANRPVGYALWLAKADPNPYFDTQNNQKYNLMGDPALRLPQPAGPLPGFGLDLAGSPDTLLAGLRQQVAATLLGEAAGAVTYDLEVLESRRLRAEAYETSYYDGSQWVPVTSYFRYALPGATIFRGTGSVQADRLTVPFKVPLQVNPGATGRYRLIVEGPHGSWAAAGQVPVAFTAVGVPDDAEGPRISLFFDDDRYRVRAGTPLRATLEDTSGISVLGTRPATSLLLEFDRSGVPANVTANVVFAPGSFTRAELEFPLPADLRPGAHLVGLTAADALGNVGSDTLSFLLVPEGVAAVEDVTLFPNPTVGPCRLIFELSDPMSVEWSIHTVAGHRIRQLRRSFDSPGPKIIEWDGRDHRGDEIANGVYLFVLRGRPAFADEREIVHTGRVVIMR